MKATLHVEELDVIELYFAELQKYSTQTSLLNEQLDILSFHISN